METPEKKINIEVPYEVSVVHNFFAWAITYKEKDSINLGEVSRLVAKWEESEVFRSIKGRLETSVKLLRDLTDLQNGAPLEQHRKEWEETMRQVYDFLNKAESHPEQLKEKTKEEFTCKICGITLENKTNLYEHYDYAHNKGL